jgi:hypothetical protein
LDYYVSLANPPFQYIITKKFWEELIPLLSFHCILVSDTSRKKTSICMCNEANKTILGGCSVGITDGCDL